MCTYNTISSHTDHFEIQKRDSEESLLTLVNLFPMKADSQLSAMIAYQVEMKLLKVGIKTFASPK